MAALSRTAAGCAKTPGSCPRKQFPVQFCWLLRGEMNPAGRRGPRREKIPEADGGGQAAPDPGLRRRCSGVGAGFKLESGHLVPLVADAQRKTMQGAANDGVGAVIEWLKRRYVAVPPHEHRWCVGEVIGQAQRRAAGGGGVVSSGRVFSSTQCIRELLKKIF